MKIVKLCLANGDEYENVDILNTLTGNPQELFDVDILEVAADGKRIYINSEFIISFEVEQKIRDLKPIVTCRDRRREG